MGIPLAVAPSNPVPGLHLTVNLLYGAASPGSGTIRALLVGPKNETGGDMTQDTEIRTVNSPEDVKTAAGQGSLPHLAYKALFANDPTARVDLLCPTKSGGTAATGTITYSGAITTDGTVRHWIQGRVIDVPWNVGEDVDAMVTKAVAYINRYADDLFVTATDAVGAGIVDLTAKGKGPAGNDVTLRARIIEGCAGGTVGVSAATLTNGATEPVFTTALASAQGTEYDFIVLCCSNADTNAASGNNPANLETHITGLNTGLNAKLQQGVVASTATIAAAKTGAVGRNEETIEHLCGVGLESLPCELAGAECGDRMRRRKLNPNSNRIGTELKGLYPSADILGDNPTEAEAIDAMQNGVSLIAYTATGTLTLMRPITTHSQDAAGNPDVRCFDVNEVDALYDYAKDLRAALPQEFKQAKIAKDRVAGDEPLPEGVVEESDVKQFIISRTKGFWVPKGVIDGDAFDAAVANGTFVVEVNATDPTQVDIFIPAEPYKILSKFGLYIAKAG